MALRAPLPSGTVTLLFTDIEGSTQHWEEQREAMPEALRRHDELLRTAIEAQDGYVFKTVGDAFCAAFSRASDGVAAAADAQRALAAEDWSAIGGLAVRMALHSGATDERDGDYFGPTVNRVARLLATAHGGQVILSGTTAPLLRGVMPEQTELRDLGSHRLKDLVEREHVWQLSAPGLIETFPPLRSLESLPNNLPRQITPLLGREDVLAEVEPLVLEHPLVTLLGTGGIGKTRVALQVGADLLEGSSDGVWFIDLAPLSDPALVVNTIAAAFSLREQGERPMLDLLLQYLRPRRLLIILDNCEHVIGEAASIADAILRAAPQVRVIATSREPLRIGGEHVYPMPSLAVPPESDSLTSDQALEYGAIGLFVQRAAASDAKFTLTNESAPIVAEICRRLDGIALAIELAAARVKVFAPRELAQKLDERFRVLTGGSRTALPRQQTMRALIDWSYGLLSEAEQRLFGRVAIFVGGWTLDAAEAVTSHERLDGLDIIDLMSSLVEKSLVVADADERRTRYRLLESTRAFALEKLEQSGERGVLSRRHAQWAADLAETLSAAWETTPDEQWKTSAEPELDNWRAALRWAFEATGDRSIGQRLAAALHSVWSNMAPSEGLEWLSTALASCDNVTPDGVRASLELWAAYLEIVTQQYNAAQAAAERALAGFTKVGDRRGLALARLFTGAARGLLGDTSGGESLLRSALDELRRLGAGRYIGAALYYLATLQLRAGDLTASRRLFAETLEIFQSVGATRSAARMAMMLAELEFHDGNAAEAVRLIGAALEAERAFKNLNLEYIAFDLGNLSAYLIALRRWKEAVAHAREALAIARERGFVAPKLWALHHLAAIAALRPISEAGAQIDARLRAARLIGYVDRCLAELQMQRSFTEQEEHAQLMRALEAALGDDAERHVDEGRDWSELRALEEALLV